MILGKADGLAIEARTSGDLSRWDQAIAEALRARERLESGGGSPAVRRETDARLQTFSTEQSHRRETLQTEQKDRQVVAGLAEARLQASKVKDGVFDNQSKLDAYLAAFRAYGINLEVLPTEDAAGRIRSSKVADELIAAVDDWASFEKTAVFAKRLEAIARAAETDRLRTRSAIWSPVATRPPCVDSARARKTVESSALVSATFSTPCCGSIRAELPVARSDSPRELVRPLAEPRPRDGIHEVGTTAGPGGRTASLGGRCTAPDSSIVHSNLGSALVAQRKLDQAIAAFHVAIRIKPDFAKAHYNLGVALRDQGKRNQAIAAFREAIRIKPDLVEAHTNLAFALRDQGKLDEAIDAYREAIRVKPDYPNSHIGLGLALEAHGKLDEAIAAFREAIRIKPDFAEAHEILGNSLRDHGRFDEAIDAYREAIRIKPDFALVHENLGIVLTTQGKLDLAIAAHRTAIRLKADSAGSHNNLGIALRRQGKLDEAIASFREATRIKPDLAEAHYGLGLALQAQGKLDEAIAAFREATRIKPDLAEAHYDLGLVLQAQGKLDEAIAAFREAIRIEPRHPMAHYNLGVALRRQAKLDESIAAFHEAIRIKPDLAEAQYGLGLGLQAQHKLDEAIAAFHEAIRIKPDYALAHTCIGIALATQGKFDEAIAAYREAIRIDPKHAAAHYNLGVRLATQGKLDEAVAAYREAIRLKPDYAEAHCNLGGVLATQGHFKESLESREKGHELGSKLPGWPFPSEDWVRDARRLVDLEAKIPAILKGEARVKDLAERLSLAYICSKKGQPAASARFWGEAFAERPELADDLEEGHRYNAACAAALGGSGSGQNAPLPDEATRHALREKALGWLRADLANWAKVLDGGNEPVRKQAVAQTLAHWKQDVDLASIRDEGALAKLPDGERDAFRVLWADVEALLRKATVGVRR